MLLTTIINAVSDIIPSNYYVHILLGLLTLTVIWAFGQGRSTDRERDLHARTILVTVSTTNPCLES